jgi:stress response protein SCP2
VPLNLIITTSSQQAGTNEVAIQQERFSMSTYRALKLKLTLPCTSLSLPGEFLVEVVPAQKYCIPTGIAIFNSLTNEPIMSATCRIEAWRPGGSGEELVSNLPIGEGGIVDLGCVISDLPPASITLVSNAPGYATYKTSMINTGTVTDDTQKLFLTPILEGGVIMVVLRWSDHPADLDLHCLIVGEDGRTERVYYNHKSSRDGDVSLDVDVQNGKGPETITLKPKEGRAYCFTVHHYSGGSTLQKSQAKLDISGIAGVTEMIVPTVGPTYAGPRGFWHCLKINQDGSSMKLNKIVDIEKENDQAVLDSGFA